MHKQLVLFHNAVAAYFSGNAAALDSTVKQFNIKVMADQFIRLTDFLNIPIRNLNEHICVI